jgi:hypothetical protein
MWMISQYQKCFPSPSNGVDRSLTPVLIAMFVAARLFILVEVVRSLAFQPPETFRTTWVASVPHVG